MLPLARPFLPPTHRARTLNQVTPDWSNISSRFSGNMVEQAPCPATRQPVLRDASTRRKPCKLGARLPHLALALHHLCRRRLCRRPRPRPGRAAARLPLLLHGTGQIHLLVRVCHSARLRYQRLPHVRGAHRAITRGEEITECSGWECSLLTPPAFCRQARRDCDCPWRRLGWPLVDG